MHVRLIKINILIQCLLNLTCIKRIINHKKKKLANKKRETDKQTEKILRIKRKNNNRKTDIFNYERKSAIWKQFHWESSLQKVLEPVRKKHIPAIFGKPSSYLGIFSHVSLKAQLSKKVKLAMFSLITLGHWDYPDTDYPDTEYPMLP